MKRLLLPLWLGGGALYVIGTLLSTDAIWFGAGDPKPIAQDISSPPAAASKVAKVEPPPISPEQSASPATADTPHAITVEQAPAEAPALANLPPAGSPEERPPTGGQATQDPASSISNQARLLQVTSAASIRNAPSASADVIGTAYAGAQVRIASREPGWAQIVDPSSGNRGWIDATLLAPSVDTASTEDSGQVPQDEAGAPNDENALSGVSEPKPRAKVEKHGSKRHYGRRGFAFRFRFRR